MEQTERRRTMSTATAAKIGTQRYYEVTAADLPVHCPMDGGNLWSMHPRVYLPIAEKGEATCPYCGARYVLKGKAGH